MKALVFLLALAVTPKPPTLYGCPPFTPVIDKVIETNPAVYAQDNERPGRVLLPDGAAEYTFTSVPECVEPLPAMEPEDPANFAPPPPVDPELQRARPNRPDRRRCAGAPTVDKPAP
jgi:hypothetical protein